MDEIRKSDKWILQRLEFDTKYLLNIGETAIGRHRQADIVTNSTICSRQHCIITLNADDSIYVENKSTSNGTFVNDTKIEGNHKLKFGDLIGLGCEGSVFQDEIGLKSQKKDDLFVFRLIHKADFSIEISDDDDDEDGNNPVTNTSPERNNGVAVPSSSPAPVEDENDEDNELIYSQQVLMEIKKEVSYSEEAHDDDFTICISDDSCDGESNSWAGKLSQDQDLVVKKLEESAKINKRKSTKQIDAIPLIPAKKARRNSTSTKVEKRDSTKTCMVTGHKTTSKPTTIVKKESKIEPSPIAQSIQPIAHSSKTSGLPIAKNGKLENVDRFDPFAKRSEKPKIRFEDALASDPINTVLKPKKTRIAHVPKPCTSSRELISILRKGNRGDKKRLHRVRFSEAPDNVREYEPNDDEDYEILIALPTKPIRSVQANSTQAVQANSFENDPLHEIITDITEWKPEWLTQRNDQPPINGVNLVVYPLIDTYTSFEFYKKIVTPLLKHELWSSIQAENRLRNGFEVNISSLSLQRRASRKRYVFHVQVAVESNSSKANVGDFALITGSGNFSFFAYITSTRFTRSGYSKTTYLTMEASETVVSSTITEAKTLIITPIANIRPELKLFNAVFYLNRTPLKSLILDPISYREPVIPNRIPKFQYTGYDKLNDDQLHILKSIYNKSVNSSTSLSLIEGPPGTGKTRLIISIILQLLFGQEMKQKLRILVLASSNAAVDIIAKRLLHIRDKMESDAKRNMMYVVRYGVLNSMDPEVRHIAPQNLKSSQLQSPSSSQSNDTLKHLLMEQKRLQQSINDLKKKENANTTSIQDSIKAYEKRFNQIDETIKRNRINESSDFDGTYQVMAHARVVCSTLSSAINLKQFIRYFDVCIIDEASQCTEPWSLVPLQYQIKSLILVGDSNQLCPVVLSSVCRENNFERSLFARLFDSLQDSNKYTMTVQYRMHPDICAFSNVYFYRTRLVSSPTTHNMVRDFPLHPYRVFNLNYHQSNADTINFWNRDEAEFICSMLKVITKHAKPEHYSYGIITPYAKQRAEIQNRLMNSNELSKHKIPVNTIDSYQGQEKDIIILCTTRTFGVGFLANPQRLNVALTRAKKCSIICGNFISISSVPVWRELISDAQRRKKYFEIPKEYSFKTIADLVIKAIPKPSSSTTNTTAIRK